MIITLALLVLIAVCASADVRSVSITLLHTNDLHGNVMPRNGSGGLARIATVVRQVRAKSPNVLLLDAGDIIHGTPEDYFSGGKATMSAMNATGYDIATIGNHEFDFGLPTLENALDTAVFPFVAANLRSADGGYWHGIQPYRIFTIDGIRIAVMGLATRESISLSWPGSVKDIRIDDPFETARGLIPTLRAQADVVLALSHLGVFEDWKLAKVTSGIDLIIGSHTHTKIFDPVTVGKTIIAQAGAYGQYLGRLDITVNQNADKYSIKERTATPLIPITDKIAQDPAVVDAYLPYRIEADARLAEVIGEVTGKISGRPNESGEIPVGDIIADAVLYFTRADVSIVDPDSVSIEGLAAGPVTVDSVFNLIRGFTRQQIIVAKMTGADLVRALEVSLNKPIPAQVSGVILNYALVDGRPIVSGVKIDGKPIDPAASYTIAAQAFLMMRIKAAVPGAAIVTEYIHTPREALMQYIRASRQISPPVSGRIIRLRQTTPFRLP